MARLKHWVCDSVIKLTAHPVGSVGAQQEVEKRRHPPMGVAADVRVLDASLQVLHGEDPVVRLRQKPECVDYLERSSPTIGVMT